MIEKRLNSRCSNRTMFDKHKQLYQSALKSSGYRNDIEYNEKEEDKTPKQRKRGPRPKREIFWFNPPYNLKVRTPIGKEFLKILEKNFPRGTKWHKFFNRHTVKLSYSCTRNIASIISAHNQKLMRTELDEPGCNCRDEPCPVEEQCLTEGVVYSGTIIAKDNNYTYYGSTGNTFKERYSNHKQDLKNITKQGTALSNKFWELKNNPKEEPTIKWQIIHRCHTLKAGMPVCDVCLTEKTRILLQHEGPEPKPPYDTIFLNKRLEIYSKCRHRRKFTLSLCNKLYEKQIEGQNLPQT